MDFVSLAAPAIVVVGMLVFMTLLNATVVWLCRKFAPTAEWWVRAPLLQVIRRLAGRLQLERPADRQHVQK